MSQLFYEKFLSLLFRGIILIVLTIGNVESLLLWIQTGNIAFYYSLAGLILVTVLYALKYVMDFRSFRGNLDLYFPNEKTAPITLKNLETEDMLIKIALLYGNGQPYHKIAKAFKLRDQNEARRLLYKSLAFLLKFYDEHKEEGRPGA